MSHNRIIFIYGPTAVGKTDFVYRLADYLPIAIINMDVGQFYRPLTIGTAKPHWQKHPVSHYLFDIHNEPVNYTVAEYRKKILELIPLIQKDQKIPVLVGGSGFYLKSLLFPPQAPSGIKISEHHEYSWQILYSIDKERAEAIDPHDYYRIKRALDVWYETGKKPSEYKPIYQPPADYIVIGLERKRDELYKRIDERVMHMMNAGWIDEVRALKGTHWEPFLEEKGFIGYREILHMLDREFDEQTITRLIHQIQQSTRHYAKRQMTFWRMLKKQCNQAIADNLDNNIATSFNLTLESIDLYINRLVKIVLG